MANPHPTPRFKPGQSGNLKGRPKREWTWAGLIEEEVERMGNDKQPIKKEVVKKLTQLAKDGDIVAIKEMFNRMDGMPPQAVDMTTKGKALDFTVVSYKDIDIDRGDSSEET